MGTRAQTNPVLAYFDKAERDRIRRVLLRYMQDNRIGTPKLRDLIAEANGLAARRDGKEPIALSTVQRFVADTHRANDTFVGLCARFATDLPDADPVAMFGDQLTAFLGAGRESCQPVPQDIAGMFACHARRDPSAGGKMWILPKGDERDYLPYSRMEIAPGPGHPFAAIRETVEHGTAPRDPLLGPATPLRRSYEGVATDAGGTVLALMRDILLGTPRIYWLGRAADGRFIGEGGEPLSQFDPGSSPSPVLPATVRIMLTPAQEGADD